MKILFVINALSFGGAEHVAARLCDQWSKNNEVVLLKTSFVPKNSYSVSNKIKIIESCPNKRVSRLKVIGIIRRTLKNEKCDVVVSFLNTGHFYTTIANIGLRIPHICSERNNPKEFPSGKIERMLRLISFSQCSRVVFQTPDAMKFFSRRIQAKGVLIDNPVPSNILFHHSGGFRTVIAAGRLEKEKNYPLLIQGFVLFHKENPSSILKIYGEGSMKQEIQKLIEDNDALNYIKLMGFSSSIPEEMSMASAFVLTSLHEGSPNSLMEALATGLPCIATDCPMGGVKELLLGCKGSILIEMNKPEKLKEALMRIASDYSFFENAAQEDSVTIKTKYDIRYISEKWLSLFREVSNK